jgi:hypothetical protein
MSLRMCEIARAQEKEDASAEAAAERICAARKRLPIEHPLHVPRFPETFCSQCGASLGPGDAGVSHCDEHAEGLES